MFTRREVMQTSAFVAAAGNALAGPSSPQAPAARPEVALPSTPVVVPNGHKLPWRMDGGVKEFHLVAEPVKQTLTPGVTINAWGYNGSSPGPVIEAVEGDRVRMLVTNKLPERTSVHWHGVFLPNGMDGVGGLTQKHIQPGETYAYEFTLRQHGTQMYHPHSDEMVQMAMGMQGFFIIHPRKPRARPVDRDFCIFLHEIALHAGTHTPNPNIMLDFNFFMFNGTVFPSTEPLVVRQNQRVRLRVGNLTMDSHPIHLHGHSFFLTGTDGGQVPESAQWPETTMNVPVGTTRDVEFVADALGDWPLHCHKTHHTMNGMGHDIPNMLGVRQDKRLEAKVRKQVPGYMAMGEKGMGGMMDMGGPPNTVPMMSGEGPFGDIEMGGMFTTVKVREALTSYEDPGWFTHPEGTVARKVG